MMYKIKAAAVFIFILLSAAAVFLYGCQKKDNQQTKIPAKEEKEHVYLRFGHDMPIDSAQHAAALKYAQIVDIKSDGRVQVEIFPDQQLGDEHRMIEMARAGELAIILPPTAILSMLIPAMQYADLPFLFPACEDVYELLDGVPGNILLERLKPLGLTGAAFWESGFKQFTANKEIRSPEDFKGLNIRVMKSRIIMDQFESFGANPIPIDFQRTYEALKDGGVDGQENPLVAIVNMKFYEVQTYVIISNHAYLGSVFAFSKDIFESLPPDIQDILKMTARELAPFERKEAIEREKAFLQTIKDSGTSVYYLSDEERGRFQAATAHIIDKYRDTIGADIIDATDQILQKKYTSAGKDEIIIGLDADMTLGSAPSGLSIKRGMEIAVHEINRQGGFLGKKVNIIVQDHAGISARGIANMKYFAKVDNLVAVMGGLHSPVALSELDIIHKEKIIYLDPWAAATAIVDNGYQPSYVFRVSVRDEYAGSFLVKQALQNYSNVALLLENTGWGRSNLKAMTEALAENKLAPAAVEWFNYGEEDITPQLMRIEGSGADVILLVANAPEGINVVKSMVKVYGKTPIISHWGITGGYFWEHVNRELTHVNFRFLQTFSFLIEENELTEAVLKKYSELYNIKIPDKITAPAGMAHAYDLVHLLARAITDAGSLDRAVIRDAMERIEFHQGLVKSYSPPFTPERHDALEEKDYIMAKYDNRGRIVPVKNPASD